MFNLCYLVICMTLQQCREYRSSLALVLPNTPVVDIFYWLNPEKLEVDESIEHSLTGLIESNSQLSQWDVVSSEAGSWLPWYYYVDNKLQCDALARLDNGFVFRENIDNYEQFFTGLAILSIAHGDVLLNLEASCSSATNMGVDGANILVDFDTMQQLMANFQQQNVDENIRFYAPGAFAKWLAPYAITKTYSMKSKDLTYCAGVETFTEIESEIPDSQNFIRLSRPLNTLGTEHQVNAIMKASGAHESVF